MLKVYNVAIDPGVAGIMIKEGIYWYLRIILQFVNFVEDIVL